MENYRGIYYNNSKSQNYFEGGAHFKYKDLYNKLVKLYNERNNNNLPQKIYNLNLSPRKNIHKEKILENTVKNINKQKSSPKSKKKTRNKKINSNLSNSDSMDNNHYKEININILDKSNNNNNDNHFYNYNDIYNDENIFKNSTNILSYYNKMFQKIHHNSINKNYHFSNRKNKVNSSSINKDKENQINLKLKNNKINKSINNHLNKNNSNKNKSKTIYNYCYLKYEDNYAKKMPKLKTNNIKNNNIFNIGKYNYKYNLYDNIYLKNKIHNNLKQLKYNSFIKENSVNKNNSSISKIKDKSKNKFIRSIDKNYNEKKSITKRLRCHIKSVDYASIYMDINCIKTPNYKIKNEILNKNNKISNEPVYNIKTILNKNNRYEELLNQVNKNQTSYAKIKKNQLSFTKSKKSYNKEIAKERIKRDTQSTEYE